METQPSARKAELEGEAVMVVANVCKVGRVRQDRVQ